MATPTRTPRWQMTKLTEASLILSAAQYALSVRRNDVERAEAQARIDRAQHDYDQLLMLCQHSARTGSLQHVVGTDGIARMANVADQNQIARAQAIATGSTQTVTVMDLRSPLPTIEDAREDFHRQGRCVVQSCMQRDFAKTGVYCAIRHGIGHPHHKQSETIMQRQHEGAASARLAKAEAAMRDEAYRQQWAEVARLFESMPPPAPVGIGPGEYTSTMPAQTPVQASSTPVPAQEWVPTAEDEALLSSEWTLVDPLDALFADLG